MTPPHDIDATRIAANLAHVRAGIAEVARAVGRDPASVQLIAVSKAHPAAAIEAAHAAGQRDFGESYAREFRDKQQALAHLPGLRWHFIGHLQRNKMKWVAGRVTLLHTLGDAPGIEALAARCRREGIAQDVLLQVNVGGEAQKRGCDEVDAEALARQIAAQEGLRLLGVMTLPPHTDDPAGAAPFFARLGALRDRLRVELELPLPVLSMGMSHDWRVAIAHGASCVRVGTAIFGSRPGRPPQC